MIFSITYNKPTNTTTIVYNGEFSFKGKPEFSFIYDDLFVDDIRASKTIQATTYKLTKEQYEEVFKYVREFDYTELRQVFPYNEMGMYLGHSLQYNVAVSKGYKFLENAPIYPLSKCVNNTWERIFVVIYESYDLPIIDLEIEVSVYDEVYPTEIKWTPLAIYSETDMPHDLPIVSKGSFWNGKEFEKIICSVMENEIIYSNFNRHCKLFFTQALLDERTDKVKPYIENDMVKPIDIMYSFSKDKFYDGRNLDQLKEDATTTATNHYNKLLWSTLGYYLTPEQQLTFEKQYADAMQYLKDSYTPTPVLDAYMFANGIPESDKHTTVEDVISRYMTYRTMSTIIMSKLNVVLTEISNIKTLKQFDKWTMPSDDIEIPESDLKTIICNKKIIIKSVADSILSQLEFEYPEIEKKLWESQYKEAQEVMENGLPENLNDIPCLYGLVKYRDTLPAATIEGRIAILAERVLINQWVWVKGASELCSQRQRYDDLITYNIEVMEQEEFLQWLAELEVTYEIPDILALYQEAAEYWQNRIYTAQNKVANK